MQEVSSRVLIIDDEPVLRQIIERALSPIYDVLALPSAKTLEKALERFVPNLMILDVRMPDEDGWQVCRRLRQDKQFDAIPIVFLSALNDESSVRQGFASGGDYYLSKPFDIEELKRTVEALINRKHRHPNEDV